MINKPKVYLVGAGSGDYELLTLKAKRLIEMCDVLIYDNLVNIDIVDLASPYCEKIYAGKMAGKHTLKQEEINTLLIEKFKENKTVVRLKGGDPIIFGRGGEEAEDLVRENIPFEIVPGITSAIAAPVYAGIPVTHRDYNSCFTVLTGHENPEKNNSSINWENIAHFNGPVVILMGVKNLPEITQALINSGRNPDEPAALIHQGSTPFQKVITSTLANIAELAKDENFKPPSILFCGKNVQLRDQLNWYEKLPLFGKNILITRPFEQSASLKDSLYCLGANVINLPAIKIEPLADYETVDKEILNINNYDWLIFTSVNGVKSFFSRLSKLNLDARHFSHLKIAAIGNITARQLLDFGIKADFIPLKYTSEMVVQGLKELNQIDNKRFLLARSNIARIELARDLANNGAIVNDLVTYNIIQENLTSFEHVDLFQNTPIDLITFTSPSTVESLKEQLPENIIEKIKNNILIASIGPVTSNTCFQIFNKVNIEAEVHNIEGLVEAIVKHYNNT